MHASTPRPRCITTVALPTHVTHTPRTHPAAPDSHLCWRAASLPCRTPLYNSYSRTYSFLTSDANKRAKSLLDRLDHVSAAGCAHLPLARALAGSLTKVDRATDKKDRVGLCHALSSCVLAFA